MQMRIMLLLLHPPLLYSKTEYDEWNHAVLWRRGLRIFVNCLFYFILVGCYEFTDVRVLKLII